MEGPIGTTVNVIDGNEEALGQETDTAKGKRKNAGKGPRPGNADPHEAVHKDRHRADEKQDQARRHGKNPRRQAKARDKGKEGCND